MTEGQRIAEKMDGCSRADTARRIDAALAEQAEATGVLWEQTSEAMKAKLAECEAQCAVLRDASLALLAVCDCVGDDEDPKYGAPKKRLRAALASTADAARAFVERIRWEARADNRAIIELFGVLGGRAPDEGEPFAIYVERQIKCIQAEERERLCAALCNRCEAAISVYEEEDGVWWHGERGQPTGRKCYAAAIRALPPRRGT